MISIEDRTVGNQYLPSYLSISSWYSPSRCHIQIQSPSTPLKVGVTFFGGMSFLLNFGLFKHVSKHQIVKYIYICLHV